LLDIDAVATQLDKVSGEVSAVGVQMQQLRNVLSQQQAVIIGMQQGHLHLRLLWRGHLILLFQFAEVGDPLEEVIPIDTSACYKSIQHGHCGAGHHRPAPPTVVLQQDLLQ